MIFIIFILLINVSFSKDKGKAAFDNGNYADARSYYENILRSRENDDAAKYGLGVSAYKQNDIEGALRALKESTNTGDKNLASKSYYNLANILRESGEMEESLKYYKKSILLNPLDKDAKIEVIGYPADVTNPEDCTNLISNITSKFGGIDFLINNEGVSAAAGLE